MTNEFNQESIPAEDKDEKKSLLKDKQEKDYQIKTGKLEGSLTALKIIFGLIALIILILFICECRNDCKSEKILEFSQIILNGLFAMGTLILGYIAGSQSKD